MNSINLKIRLKMEIEKDISLSFLDMINFNVMSTENQPQLITQFHQIPTKISNIGILL